MMSMLTSINFKNKSETTLIKITVVLILNSHTRKISKLLLIPPL